MGVNRNNYRVYGGFGVNCRFFVYERKIGSVCLWKKKNIWFCDEKYKGFYVRLWVSYWIVLKGICYMRIYCEITF